MIRYTATRNNAWVISCAGPGAFVSADGRFSARRIVANRWVMRDIHADEVIAVRRTLAELLPVLEKES